MGSGAEGDLGIDAAIGTYQAYLGQCIGSSLNQRSVLSLMKSQSDPLSKAFRQSLKGPLVTQVSIYLGSCTTCFGQTVHCAFARNHSPRAARPLTLLTDDTQPLYRYFHYMYEWAVMHSSAGDSSSGRCDNTTMSGGAAAQNGANGGSTSSKGTDQNVIIAIVGGVLGGLGLLSALAVLLWVKCRGNKVRDIPRFRSRSLVAHPSCVAQIVS